jgi:hypothetical protein
MTSKSAGGMAEVNTQLIIRDLAMPKKLFLHVGTHKTGTTSLQNFLSANRDALREHGVLIPSAGCVDTCGGHHNIAWELNEDPRFKDAYGTVEELCSEISEFNGHTVVVSSEDFEYLYLKEDVLTMLKHRLEEAGCLVEIVIFFREFGEYIISLYQELLKHGLRISFRAFKKRIMESCEFTMRGNWRFCFRYDSLAQGFIDVFGEGMVSRNAYCNPIEPVFLDLIGLRKFNYWHIRGLDD